MNLFEALHQVFSQPAMDPPELEGRSLNARSRDYWNSLGPSLTVQVREAAHGEPDLSSEVLDAISSHFRSHGYFQTGPILPEPILRIVRSAISTVQADGWPPVFSLVYDQVWGLFRNPSVDALLNALIGPGHRLIPHLWIHHLVPGLAPAGWPPHVDGPRPDRVTVWIALTDATLENGCMYVIPDFVTKDRTDIFRAASLTGRELQELLQSCRALPAPAGSLLGWNFSVIHWGSRCSAPRDPRISLSLEFIAAGVPPEEDESPLVEESFPTLESRLKLIARSILAYTRFEPRLLRFNALARRLLADP